MKKNLLLFILAPLVLPTLAFAQTLPATAVLRAAGPADNLEHYSSGYIAKGKAMAGEKDGLHWKAFVVFDVVSSVEELAQNPDATLRLALDWVKSADDVEDLNFYYVGSLPSADFTDRDMWDIFLSSKGVKIGEFESYELASLQKRTWVEFDLKGKVASGEVSPVNRFMVFRVESESMEDPEGNGLVGLATDLSQHSLIVGESEVESGASTGGY
jgi:hypothetical protein